MAEAEVFTFRLAACDNQVDRDFERFTEAALEELAVRFVGRPVLLDHKWSAAAQTARVYAGGVESGSEDGVRRLVLRCYMPRLRRRRSPTIAAIESGTAAGVQRGRPGGDAGASALSAGRTSRTSWCEHVPGMRRTTARLCYMELDGAEDAYEVSHGSRCRPSRRRA